MDLAEEQRQHLERQLLQIFGMVQPQETAASGVEGPSSDPQTSAGEVRSQAQGPSGKRVLLHVTRP